MSRPKHPESPNDAPTGEKAVISFRLPALLASWLRKQAEVEGGSLNDIVVTALDDIRTWFAASKPMAEMLDADRQAFGDSPREYLQRLLQYRYDQLTRDTQGVGKKPRGPPGTK